MPDFISYGILGLVQGLSEFLPISSTGHLIVTRALLGLETPDGLAIDAVLQCGTVLAVIVYFRSDLIHLARTAVRQLFWAPVEVKDARLLRALIAGTVPGVVAGLLLESTMDTVFRNPHLVAYALIVGSLFFMAAEYVYKRVHVSLSLEDFGWRRGFVVGVFQSLALVPGMSRSGMTISGGLFLGFTREAAARFGFLLSVPIIAGSGLKKLIDLYSSGMLTSVEGPLIFGTLIAFVSGLLAIHGLLLFVRTRTLYAFVVYRVILALLILSFL